MEELVATHSAIMDRFDPEKRVGMVVDEWGTWHDPEPGTNPAFLYQQNTLRDALAAAVNLNIFNRHCDRVSMANIAQTINVLQAMVLTDKWRMVRTPTYHVFEMYKVHQSATLVPVELETPEYKLGDALVPMLHASASRDAAGRIHLSMVNLDPNTPAMVVASPGLPEVTGRILTAAAMNGHNTFDNPDVVSPAPFDSFTIQGDSIRVLLPAKAVVVLEIGQSSAL
jgi:alpha-N-arabinofuranosidase